MKLYIDLDGVLADFDKKKLEIFGTLDVQDEIMWPVIHKYEPYFFLDLELKPDAIILFKYCKQFSPIILTALPKKNSEVCEKQKRSWVKDHLGEIQVITCFREEKQKYSVPGAILIDDNKNNIREWNMWGKWNIPSGFGILHNNAQETMLILEKFLFPL